MRSRFPTISIATVSLGFAACQPAPATLSEADVQGIQNVTDQFIEYFRAKDWDGLRQLYTEDAVLMPPNQPAVEGRSAIRDWMAASPPIAQFTLTNDHIDGVGDLAYVRGRYVMILAIQGSPADSGKFVEIRRREPDGSWKLSVDIFNSNLPPLAPQNEEPEATTAM